MLLAISRLKQNASTLPKAFEKFYKLVKSLKTQILSQLDFRENHKYWMPLFEVVTLSLRITILLILPHEWIRSVDAKVINNYMRNDFTEIETTKSKHVRFEGNASERNPFQHNIIVSTSCPWNRQIEPSIVEQSFLPQFPGLWLRIRLPSGNFKWRADEE